MNLPPPSFALSKVGADIVLIEIDAEPRLVGNENSSVLYQRAVVNDETLPALYRIANYMSPG